LLRDLTASLADHSLPQRLRYYSNFDLLAIDEFGFDRIERAECGQAASLLYKVVDSRGPNRSQHGADSQAALMSIFRTLKQRGHDPIRTVVHALAHYLTTRQLPPLPQPKSTSDG